MYEHSYHMDYGASAAAYVDAFMQNIRWENVARLYREQRASEGSHPCQGAPRWVRRNVMGGRERHKEVKRWVPQRLRERTTSGPGSGSLVGGDSLDLGRGGDRHP